MVAFILSFLVGILCIVFGILVACGNLSLLHDYHYHRVSQEDRPAFGKKVGLGIVVIGCAVVAFSALSAATLLTENGLFLQIGIGVLFAGIGVGGILCLRAVKTFNNGVF